MRLPTNKNWTRKDSIELSIYAADLVINRYEGQEPANDSPRKAIETAKACLRAEDLDEAARCVAKRNAFRAGVEAADAAGSADFAAECVNNTIRAVIRAGEDDEEAVRAAERNAADWVAAKRAAAAASVAGFAAASDPDVAAECAAECVYNAICAAADAADVLTKCDSWILARIEERAETGREDNQS